MLMIGVLNLKGGSSKTTTSAFLLHALHERGRRVWGADADPQGSLLHWSGVADWPMPVVGMPEKNFHSRLDGVIGDRADAVITDTPPLEEQAGIVRSVARRADLVVIPMAPTPIEYERIAAVREALAEVADLRADEQPPPHVVLLTRTVPGAASTTVYREELAEDGDRVLSAEVRRLERFAQSYGDPITDALRTAYGDAATEIEHWMEVAA